MTGWRVEVFNTSDVGVVTVSVDGVVLLTADHDARQVMGMPTGVTGKPLRVDVLDEHGVPLEWRLDRLEVGQQSARVVGVRWVRDGSWVWVRTTASRSHDELVVLVTKFEGEPPLPRGWDCDACG